MIVSSLFYALFHSQSLNDLKEWNGCCFYLGGYRFKGSTKLFYKLKYEFVETAQIIDSERN